MRPSQEQFAPSGSAVARPDRTLGAPARRRFVVGGYGPPVGTSEGLVLLEHDLRTDEMRTSPLAGIPSPTFVTASTQSDLVLCVSETDEGSVHSLRWTPDRTALELVSSRPSHGAHPCHLTLHPAGFVVSTNYTSGTVVVHPLGADGVLGPATDVHQLIGSGPDGSRQEQAHAHMATVVDGDLAVADLGSDRVWHLGLDDRGRITQLGALELAPGSGTRQVIAAPEGRSVHVLGELDGSVTIADWPPRVDSPTHTIRASTAPLPPDNLSAALVPGLGPGMVLVSHRGADMLAEVDVSTRPPQVRREFASGGCWPRHFAVVGHHLYVGNQRSDRVTCLDLRQETPGEVGHVATPAPSCLVQVDVDRG